MKSKYTYFFLIHCKTKRKQLEKFLEATYGLCINKYFEIINLKLGGRSLATK